jgi:tetratricopeptide (TPR) repeat protein
MYKIEGRYVIMESFASPEQRLQSLLLKKDWEGCLEVLEKVPVKEQRNEIAVLSLKVYQGILDTPGCEEDIRALRGMAAAYYTDYISSISNKKQKILPCPKKESKKKACEYYEKILRKEHHPKDVFQYGTVLYKNTKDFSSEDTFPEKCDKKNQAFALYDEAVQILEDNNDTGSLLYSRACYGLCRCGLESFNFYSALLDEIHLLFPVKLSLYGSQEEHCQKFHRICHCIEAVRKQENLPRVVEDIEAVVHSRQRQAMSWDVYYMMGKIFDCAYQFNLCNDTKGAYASAVRYYGYACEIDYRRRREGLPVSGFTHMYTSLLTLYIRGRNEQEFYRFWETYHPLVRFSEAFRLLSQIRWLILKENYSEAEQVLESYCHAGKWRKGLSERKATILMDIIYAKVKGSTAGAAGAYSSFQMKQLERLAQKGGKQKVGRS